MLRSERRIHDFSIGFGTYAVTKLLAVKEVQHVGMMIPNLIRFWFKLGPVDNAKADKAKNQQS